MDVVLVAPIASDRSADGEAEQSQHFREVFRVSAICKVKAVWRDVALGT